jgi:hypothetical protein
MLVVQKYRLQQVKGKQTIGSRFGNKNDSRNTQALRLFLLLFSRGIFLALIRVHKGGMNS